MTQIKTRTLEHEFPKELEPYKGLIYCPLDLPEPPEVDLDKLIDYLAMRDQRDKGTPAGSVNGAAGVIPLDSPYLRYTASWSKDKDRYPWRLIHILRSDLEGGGQEYFDEFKQLFPQVADYVLKLPVEKIFTFSLLNQKPDTDVGAHSDPDLWFGIRFYLVNRSPAKLFFKKALAPAQKRLLNLVQTPAGIRQIPWDRVVQDEKVYAKYPQSRFPFHLTCTHAIHGVDAVPADDEASRVTGFVICKVNPVEYAKLLERSLEKYGDYAVWWDR
jgi:hypothetical protein